jgi:hypothetical protein
MHDKLRDEMALFERRVSEAVVRGGCGRSLSQVFYLRDFYSEPIIFRGPYLTTLSSSG